LVAGFSKKMSLRTQFEALEQQVLKPYAIKSGASRGRQFSEDLPENRTCFQRDRDRIVHAKAFRRLKHKTQVFVALESDHYRSRLTHTLEVAQIARHLSRVLGLNEDLTESIALAHDLGHTPFGHAGEREMNACMADFGGFEHNNQSLRVVDLLETHYPNFQGLNLSFETRHGLMKYKAFDAESFTSLEAQVSDISDGITYNSHDLEDGLSAGFLLESDLAAKVPIWQEYKKKVLSQYSNLDPSYLARLITSQLISALVIDAYQTTSSMLIQHDIQTVSDLQKYPNLVSFSPEMTEKNNVLRRYLFQQFYSHPQIFRMNKQGQLVIRHLFNSYMQEPQLMPIKHQNRISETCPISRVVCDYISGMTDNFAMKEHRFLVAS